MFPKILITTKIDRTLVTILNTLMKLPDKVLRIIMYIVYYIIWLHYCYKSKYALIIFYDNIITPRVKIKIDILTIMLNS